MKHQKRSIKYGGLFEVDNKLKEIEELEQITSSPSFWNEKDTDIIIKKLNELKKITEDIVMLKKDTNDFSAILNEKFEPEMLDILNEEFSKINEMYKNIEFKSMFRNLFDSNNAVLEVHAGAGGTESCDWALMLYRMYTRWAEKNNFKVEIIDYTEGEEAGIKSATLEVIGTNAYGYLKSENGVHRLVRLSPFDSNNRRHTSFAAIDITPEFNKDIEIEINEKDLKIDVYRSSGAGGQSVNTTDSAVRITHLPTGIVITCQNERSQIKNKEKALGLLKNKLYKLELDKQDAEIKQHHDTKSNIEFGSQIRSYVMHPYSLVKDHRTNYETSSVDKVLDGDLNPFIEDYLRNL